MSEIMSKSKMKATSTGLETKGDILGCEKTSYRCTLGCIDSQIFCYLTSCKLKGTTWIPRGPPSLDTSTGLSMPLQDHDG